MDEIYSKCLRYECVERCWQVEVQWGDLNTAPSSVHCVKTRPEIRMYKDS